MAGADDSEERLLLARDERLVPGQRKSLRTHEIVVPEGTGALRLVLELEPRQLLDRGQGARLIAAAVREQLDAARREGVTAEAVAVAVDPLVAHALGGLRNLVNLTVTDSTGRHRGRWDSNLPDQAGMEDVIAREWATPGFIAGPLPAGRWRLTLEVHEVLEPVRLRLRVTGTGEISTRRPASRRPPAPPAPAPARQFAVPSPAGWLRGELHCHSTASDGHFEPGELVARAGAVGLDFLALTDHNSTAGLGRDRPTFPVIAGCEITTFHGHFLALGLPPGAEAPAWYDGDRPLTAQELAREVHRRGALFGVAHPFVLGNPICCGCRLERELPRGSLDLLEVWSRGGEDGVALRHALRLFDRLRGSGRRVVATAGRDWHGVAQEGPGFPATVVRAGRDVAEILTALRQGACYLSRGPALSLALATGRRRATLGQDLGLPRGTAATADLVARVDDLDEEAWLRLLVGGAPILERRVAGPSFAIEVPAVRAAPGGVRLELWDRDGAPLALSNPVEFFRVEVGP